MHKTRNRLIAALLTFAMCLGVISPLSAFADGAQATLGDDSISSLATAIKYAYSTNEEVKLASSFILDSDLEITGTVTLDLNGNTLTMAEGKSIQVKGGSLTVKDSSTNGTIAAASSTSSTTALVAVSNGGTFKLTSGTIDATSATKATAVTYAVGASDKANTITVEGGEIKAALYAISSSATADTTDTSSVTISGGTIQSTNSYAIQALTSAKIKISGGSILGKSWVIRSNTTAQANLEITGGKFNKLDNTLKSKLTELIFEATETNNDQSTLLYEAKSGTEYADNTRTALYIRLGNDITLNTLYTASSYNVTFDLYGYKLNYTGATASINNSAILTIKDSKATGKAVVDGASNGSFDGGTFNYGGTSLTGSNAIFMPEAGATVAAENVKFTCGSTSVFFPKGDAAKVEVTNCQVTGDVYCVGTNSAVLDNSGVQIILKDSTFTSTGTKWTNDDCPVMINVEGSLTINNCVITGHRQGVFVRAGTAKIENTTIKTLGTYSNKEDHYQNVWTDGNNVPAAALVVGSQTSTATAYAYDATATLTNVKLVADNSFPALYTSSNSLHNTEVIITGSVVTGDILEDAKKNGGTVNVTIDENTADNITGLTKAMPTAYLPEDYEQVEGSTVNSSDAYVIVNPTQNVKNGVLYLGETAATVSGEGTTKTATTTLNPGDTLQATIKRLLSDQTVTWTSSDSEKVAVSSTTGNTVTITALKATATGETVTITAKARYEKTYIINVTVSQINASWDSTSLKTVTVASGNANEATVDAPTLTVTGDANATTYAEALKVVNDAIKAEGITWKTYGLASATNSTVTILPTEVAEKLADNAQVDAIKAALNAWIADKAGENNAAIIRYALPDVPTATVESATAPDTSTSMSYTTESGETASFTNVANNGTIELVYNQSATVKFTLPADGTYENATVTWALASTTGDATSAADADGNTDKAAVTVTNNSVNTATIKATKVDATGVSVVATISVAGKPELTTTQSVTVTVAQQASPTVTTTTEENATVLIKVNDTNTEATMDELKTAFGLAVKDAYTGEDLEGVWALGSVAATDAAKSATATFAPTDTTSYGTVNKQLSWTDYVEIKLVLDKDATGYAATMEGDIYTSLKFKLVSADDDESVNTALTNATDLATAISNLGTQWKASTKNNLYPVEATDAATYDTDKTVTNPTTLIAYLNEKLASVNKYYRVVATTLAPDATEIEDEKEYTVNRTELATTKTEGEEEQAMTVADVFDSTSADFSTIQSFFNKGKEEADQKDAETLSIADVQKAFLSAMNEKWDVADATDLNGKTDLNQQANVASDGGNVVLTSAIYDITYVDEDGEPGEIEAGKKVQIFVPYPEDSSGEQGNYLVAHLIMHSTETEKNGTVEYLPIVDRNDKGVYVKVSSLSLVSIAETSAQIEVPDEDAATTETPTDDKKTDTEAVAPAAKDDSGAIILAGAVVATVVVGGIIYYNWDKLPVHKIEGTVVDANGAAVANATVTLAKDGKVVKTITTDANGYYSAKVAKGDYTITVTVGEASATAEGSTGASAQLAIA